MSSGDFNTDYAKFSSLVGGFVVSLVVGAVLIFAVEVMRIRYAATFDYYNTRLLTRHRKVRRRLRVVPPPPQPNSLLGWVPLVYNMGDSEYFRLVGLDAYMLFRFTRLCCLLNVEFVVLGMLVLTPMYFYGGENQQNMNKVTILNLDGSWSLFLAPIILAWVYCFHFFWLVGCLFYPMLIKTVDQGDPGVDRQTSYTAIVEDIPPGLSSEAVLKAYMQELFNDEVCFASVAHDLSDIRALQNKCRQALDNLEVAILARDKLKSFPSDKNDKNLLLDQHVNECEKTLSALQHELNARTSKRKVWINELESDAFALLSAARENAIDDREGHIAKMDVMMEQLYSNKFSCDLRRDEYTHHSKEKEKKNSWNSSQTALYKWPNCILFFVRGIIDVLGKILGYAITTVGIKLGEKHFLRIAKDLHTKTGFVTFQTLVSNVTACQVILSNQGFLLSHAPEARDILWDNVAVPTKTIMWRNAIFNVALCVFALFWSSMVGLIISFRDYLWSHLSDPQIDQSFVMALIYNYFVTGILLAIIQLLPIIFRFVSKKFIREKSKSEVERRLISRFFFFQVLNVFFIVSGVDIIAIVRKPSRLVEILGTEVPAVATYASTIIIIKLLTGLPMYLLRMLNLLRTIYMHLATNIDLRTPRDWRRGAALPPQPLYGNIYPSFMMTMLLSFVYSILAPFVCIFAVMFFACAGIIFKFLGLWVYLPEFESGGSFARRLFWTLCICILTSHLSFIGHIIYMNGSVRYLVLGVVPLPILVTIWAFVTDRRLHNLTRALSLEATYLECILFSLLCSLIVPKSATYIDRHEHDNMTDGGGSKMFIDDIYCQPELQHMSVEPEIELNGCCGEVYGGSASDYELSLLSSPEGPSQVLERQFSKQSRKQAPPTVPEWGNSELMTRSEKYISTPELPNFNTEEH